MTLACSRCQVLVRPGARFCPRCGQSVALAGVVYPTPAGVMPQGTLPLAPIATAAGLPAPVAPTLGYDYGALVLGVIGLCGGFLCVLPPVLAIVFGLVSINQAKRQQRRASGLAKAGLTCGVVGAVIALVTYAAIAA